MVTSPPIGINAITPVGWCYSFHSIALSVNDGTWYEELGDTNCSPHTLTLMVGDTVEASVHIRRRQVYSDGTSDPWEPLPSIGTGWSYAVREVLVLPSGAREIQSTSMNIQFDQLSMTGEVDFYKFYIHSEDLGQCGLLFELGVMDANGDFNPVTCASPCDGCVVCD